MNRLFLSLSVILLLSSFHSERAQAQSSPARVPTSFSKLYAPGGFDSNDHVQIVGEGMFRNTCYRHADTTVRLDEASKRIYLGPVAYEYGGLCLQLILPFERVLDVGILSPGKWEVFQGSEEKKLGEVSIRPATTDSADDFLYAPVSQAFLQQKGSVTEVLLSGEFSNDCLSVEQVRTTIEANVIVLQPISKIENRNNCKNGKFAFAKTVVLKNVTAGRYLLHVRSLNGNAINSLVNVL
jgi:hypothetical protein